MSKYHVRDDRIGRKTKFGLSLLKQTYKEPN